MTLRNFSDHDLLWVQKTQSMPPAPHLQSPDSQDVLSTPLHSPERSNAPNARAGSAIQGTTHTP